MLNAPDTAPVLPVPDRAIACGLPTPLLVILMDVERAPAADGVKVTLKLQVAAAATLPVQVELLIANSAALLLANAEMVTAVPPVLVNANACGPDVTPTLWVPNAKAPGTLRAPGGTTEVPVPLRAIDCGLPVPVLVMVIDDERAPAADGVKVTLKLQLAPAATLPAHVDALSANSAALVLATDEIVTAAPPVLVSVNACGELAVPTAWVAPNPKGPGTLSTPGFAAAWPVPERLTVFAPALLLIVRVALRAPEAVGANDTLIVHDAPAANVAAQVLVAGNSVPLLLVTLTPVAVAVPVLDTVTVVAALVVPIVCAAGNA